MTKSALSAALLLLASPASAQAPAPYDRAIAAGYKALMLCGAMFNGGRTQAQAEALELKGIYPEYDAIVPTLAARADRRTDSVTVAFDPSMPERIAAWKPGRGCTIAPIGAREIVLASPIADPPPPDRAPFKAVRTSAATKAAVARAFDGAYGAGTETTAVVVTDGGKHLLAERYRPGFGRDTAQRTWSVAKSLSGTIIGAAAHARLIDLRGRAPVPEWSRPGDPRRAITIDNLMRMASGLHSATAGNRTDAVYFGGTAVTEETVAWPLEVRPGTRFRYANNDILLAVHALRMELPEEGWASFPDALLFGPLGMTHTVAERDWRGDFILSSQVWSTARDLARFGLLYLNDGVWNGQRILPEGWVKYVTTPSGPQPDGPFGYGATFWLLNKSPGVPADTFAAFGNRGQYVVIIPSRRVVIVRRGEDPAGASFDIAKFTADVLAAMR